MKYPRISCEKYGGGEGWGEALLRFPPLSQQASGQIFKNDVNGFFRHLGYLLHAFAYR
jgi:hypothetical protein